MTTQDISVAIPTYQREAVLIEAISALLAQSPAELLVVDQTAQHDAPTLAQLAEWHSSNRIRWIRLPRPSITQAMNTALTAAARPLVLFLDDDIIPGAELLAAHIAGHAEGDSVWAVSGQVLQPGEEPKEGPVDLTESLGASLHFRFNSASPAWIRNGMAGNLSVKRMRALQVGGFDENFTGVAYRFETEFCRRLASQGGKILFQPSASIRHLKHPSGGTRSRGSHLTSPSPAHGVGDYYFALGPRISWDGIRYAACRPFREIATRFHARHPWWIPVKWIGEMAALAWAVTLILRGPRYASRATS